MNNSNSQKQHFKILKTQIADQGSVSNEQDAELPQPQNSNHLSTAPLRDKLLTNSSYLAAEIPLKLGHFMSNLWISSTELSNSLFQQQQQHHEGEGEDLIWLLGRSYRLKPLDKIEQDILEAKNDEMFKPRGQEDDEHEQQEVSSTNDAWPPDFYEDFTSRLWMTYRHNYPPMRPSNHTTDIGWGCMLRSGQSLLANTLLTHFLRRDWRRQKQTHAEKQIYWKIVHWFLDELSSRAPFSIHRIALLGKQLGKNIGEWFGPSTLSQVIEALVSDFQPAQLSVYVATDGVIYTDDVQEVTSGKKPRSDFGCLTRKIAEDDGREEAKSLYNSSNNAPDKILYQEQKSFKPVLILIPLRLGIDSLHPTYYPALKTCFKLPSFVGIAGGKPNSSLYFMGIEGNDLIYLDPHFSRQALETKSLKDYTKEDFDTYHCLIPRRINIAHLDPSMMLGFYCRNQREFDVLCEQVKMISQTCNSIFCIEKSAPVYEDDDIQSENDFGVVSDENNSCSKENIDEEDSDNHSIF